MSVCREGGKGGCVCVCTRGRMCVCVIKWSCSMCLSICMCVRELLDNPSYQFLMIAIIITILSVYAFIATFTCMPINNK